MKSQSPLGACLITLVVLGMAAAESEKVSPIQKVIGMITDLEKKVIKEGEDAQKEYEKFAEWCEDGSKNLAYEIKTAKAEVEELKATIEEETSKAASLTAEIEELGASLSEDEGR